MAQKTSTNVFVKRNKPTTTWAVLCGHDTYNQFCRLLDLCLHLNIGNSGGLLYKMPRAQDIGWQHGKMIGGRRHHLQCNYCHRTMIGGITRFKKHLACKGGEITGCDAVPKEVKELIRKHLDERKINTTGRKQPKVDTKAPFAVSSEDEDADSDESDTEIAATRLEGLRTMNGAEITCQSLINENQRPMVETREFFDASSANQHKDDKGLAPPRATDPGWAHGIMVNGGGREKIRCKYCQKVIHGGGISRLKQHLAGERGNVAPCEEVPDNVKVQIQEQLHFRVIEKIKRQRGLESRKNSFGSSLQSEEGGVDDIPRNTKMSSKQGAIRKTRGKEDDEGTSNQPKKYKKHFVPMVTPVVPVVQNSLQKSLPSKGSIDHADMAVARYMYDAGIPFSCSNSNYFQQMADAIVAAGPGYRVPTYHSLRGKLLNRSVKEVGERCHDLKKSWEATGCSVMVDRWSDRTGRTVINFFVYCPKGTVFLKSVDATDITKSSEALLNIFDTVVQEVGPKNIVNFVTDTMPSYKTAGKALMSKYKTFFWSACSAHCIDLMLEEIGEMDGVKDVMAKTKEVTQFIYNNDWVLDLMRKRTGGRDIVELANTRFASEFLTLQSIVYLKDPLRQMFTSPTWMQSTFSKQRVGLKVAKTLMDPLFWSLCDRALKVTKPLLTVLHLADCEERPPVVYIYDAMENAKKSIIMAFNNEESDYLPYLDVINRVWQEELHSPIHAAGYYLNPSIYYNPNFSTNKVIQKGLLDCIETLEPNLTSQVMITSQLNFYEDAVGDFGRPMALRGRDSLAPATWWSRYAADYPELQQLAIRVLSQTCSTIKCERSWCMFERIHAKKRNRLEHQRLNDVIFVHYNMRLQKRREACKAQCVRSFCDPICVETIDADVGDWVEDPASIDANLMDMDASVPISVSAEAQSIDTCNDNTKD